jgi:hypothetical protein
MIQYTCPVCAHSQMPYPADEGNICPCCGTEFGYDDTMGTTYRDLRDAWVARYAPWFSPIDGPPLMWDGVVQLILADYDFTMPDWMADRVTRPGAVVVPGLSIDAWLQPLAA